jgi:hypothetical protein
MFRVAVIVFLLGAGAFVPVRAQADICSEVVTARGSDLQRSSPIFDRSGFRVPDIKLGFFCRLKPSQINVRFFAQGESGKLYRVRDVWYQAAAIRALPNVKPAPEVQPVRHALVGDAWMNSLQPQFDMLSKLAAFGARTCTSGADDCLPFRTALENAERGSSSSSPSRITFAVGEIGRGASKPVNGAVMDSIVSAPSNAPVPGLSEHAWLTLYVQKRAYRVLDLQQALTLSSPIEYQMDALVGADVAPVGKDAGYYNFQRFAGDYKGSTLSFSQSDLQGKDFDFCPPVTFTFNTPVIPLTAAMHCFGHTSVRYDVNALPANGYFRIEPAVNLRLEGTLVTNAGIGVGTLQGDLTLASFGGSAGGMYGYFQDPWQPGASMLAYRQFAYYDAEALRFTLTASFRTIWGARPSSKTLYAFRAAGRSLAPSPSDWYVVRVR